MSKGKVGFGFTLTAEEEAALVEAVDEHSLDFDRIKAEAGARFGDRSVDALYDHFRQRHPDRYEELRGPTPIKWTAKEEAALKWGHKKHGADWEKC